MIRQRMLHTEGLILRMHAVKVSLDQIWGFSEANECVVQIEGPAREEKRSVVTAVMPAFVEINEQICRSRPERDL